MSAPAIRQRTQLLRLCIRLLVLLLVGSSAVLGPPGSAGAAPDRDLPLSPTAPPEGGGRTFDFVTHVDANLLDLVVTNYGVLGDWAGSALEYPIGSGMYCLWAGGIWVGGLAPDGLRMAVAEYGSEYQPGRITSPGGWTDPYDPRYRVYKLTREDGPGDPDYDEWPWIDGAPLDADGNPLNAGEQTLWSVFNDADPARHTVSAGGTDPIGLEVSQLTYAYEGVGPFDRVILMDYTITHKGTDPLEDVFFGIWLDADLGGYDDDLAGCDSVLQASFVYNGNDVDDIYGSSPPALGVAVLEGPGDPEHQAYAAVDYVNGWDPDGAAAAYNLLQGLDRDGNAVIDPTTGYPTRFWHGGDPVTGEGWNDTESADKRVLLSIGPFDLEPGQTERVRLALVVGQGPTRTESVAEMKQIIRALRSLEQKKAFPDRSVWALGGFYPEPFCPGSDPPSQVCVIAPRPGRIQVTVEEAGGQHVATLVSDEDVGGWIHALPWDGTDDGGQLVGPGEYRFVLEVLEPTIVSSWLEEGASLSCPDRLSASVEEDGRNPSPSGRPNRTTLLRGGGWIMLPAFAAGDGRNFVRLQLFDLSGRCLRTLQAEAGSGRSVWWDGRDDRGNSLPSGLYLYRVETAEASILGRALLVR